MAAADTMAYKHTQFGWVTIGVCGGLIVFLNLLPKPVPGFTEVLLLASLLLVAVMFLMGTLTVEVDKTHVRVKFGIGWIRKNFPLDEIASVQPVRNRWWWGWGIRLIPGGWLYNVSGLDAVELVLDNRKIFRIGTDEPRVLADFIRARMGKVI